MYTPSQSRPLLVKKKGGMDTGQAASSNCVQLVMLSISLKDSFFPLPDQEKIPKFKIDFCSLPPPPPRPTSFVLFITQKAAKMILFGKTATFSDHTDLLRYVDQDKVREVERSSLLLREKVLVLLFLFSSPIVYKDLF